MIILVILLLLLGVSIADKVCWSHGYVGYMLPGGSFIPSNRFSSLESAKLACESAESQCDGITFTFNHGLYGYWLRQEQTLIPSAPLSSIQETSFLKIPCDPSVPRLPQPTLPSTSYITSDFYKANFNCESKVKKGPPQKIERIWIWGERNSGTGMTQRLMNLNFNLSTEAIGGLPWKHGFISQQDLKDMDKTLNIFLVKDAYGWLNSMKRNPHHAPYFKDVTWPTFVQSQWFSLTGDGTELDLNPETQTRFENILQLRAAKLRDWIKIRECLPYHYTLRYEDLIRNVSQVILEIAQQFQPCGLRLESGAPNEKVCIVRYGDCSLPYEALTVKSKHAYYLKRDYLREIPLLVLPFVKNNLDYPAEKVLGYSYPTIDFNYSNDGLVAS